MFSVVAEINNVFNILEEHNRIVLCQSAAEREEDELYDIDWKEGRDIQIRGDIVSFVERCDEELNKSLQHLDAHSTEYIERLKDEVDLYTLFMRVKKYYEKIKSPETIVRIQAMRMEHLYYKVCFLHCVAVIIMHV
jgi:translation initiation factor 3 subunit C